MTDTPPLETFENRSKKRAALNGLKGSCPKCGDAPLFRAYIKPVDTCTSCGENWIDVRADDAPAWATMLIVGHMLAPFFHMLALNSSLPSWAASLILAGLGLVFSLIILQPVKGGFMGLIWAGRIPTS